MGARVAVCWSVAATVMLGSSCASQPERPVAAPSVPAQEAPPPEVREPTPLTETRAPVTKEEPPPLPAPPNQTTAPAKADKDGVAVRPVLIQRSPATYPEEAREKGIEGTVKVRLRIDPTGVVTAVGIVDSVSRELDAAATEAAFKMRFKPALDDGGKPITSEITFHFRFRIR